LGGECIDFVGKFEIVVLLPVPMKYVGQNIIGCGDRDFDSAHGDTLELGSGVPIGERRQLRRI
jgi:hypothetical protein